MINNHFRMGWEMGWDGEALPVVSHKGKGRAGHTTNLLLLPTATVFFLQQRPFLSEREGVIDSTKGQGLAFPCKAGTSLL